MNTNEPEKTIDLCLLTDHFVRRATEAGIQPEALFFSLDRQISTNPFARKICFIQPENLNLAPVLLQHGISVVPSQNSELQLLMEALLLHENEGKNCSILISECPTQMADLLRVMRQAQIHVNVLSITECPRLYDAWVKSWTNIAAEVQTVSDETDSEPEEEVCKASEIIPEPEPVVEMTQALEVSEEIPESEAIIQTETPCEPENEVSAIPEPIAESIVEQEPPLKEAPKSLPKAKSERELSLREKTRKLVDSLAVNTMLLPNMSYIPDTMSKMNLNSKESSAVTPGRIIKCLSRCLQLLSTLVDEPNGKKQIVKCSGYIVKLCRLADSIHNLTLNMTCIKCRDFIEKEIAPKWPISELKSSETVNPTVLQQIEKKIFVQLKNVGSVEPQELVWKRLSKRIWKLKNEKRITQDTLLALQRDVNTLFYDFDVAPEDDKMCDLIQQIKSKITGKLEVGYEMSLILDEIEQREIEKALADCSEEELNDKYQHDPNIQKLRDFFRNKILVVVGGTPRKEQKEGFEKAFQCEIDWGETNHCQSLNRFSAAIKNEKVEALLTLRDKASHKHCLELYTEAKKKGKKLFRIAHMNPIVVAYNMMKQYSNNIL